MYQDVRQCICVVREVVPQAINHLHRLINATSVLLYSHDGVYGAVIVHGPAIARVHPVHLTNDWRENRAATDRPFDQNLHACNWNWTKLRMNYPVFSYSISVPSNSAKDFLHIFVGAFASSIFVHSGLLIIFTVALCGKFAITWVLNIPQRLNCVATLPCKIHFLNHAIRRHAYDKTYLLKLFTTNFLI